MNDLQDEIGSIQQTFGSNPHVSLSNPGGLSRNYGTVEERATQHARGTDLPFYRGQAASMSITANSWNPVAFTAMADDHNLASSNGLTITLNETGMWLLHARAEYKSTGHTLTGKAQRKLRIELDGADVGLHDFVGEKSANAFALHCHISWPENLPAGTTVSVSVRTDVTAPDHPMLTNVTLRADLLRTTDGVPNATRIHALGGP
ncbi:hypothetical protein [Nonomuraea typhae]|uniref:Uncharacterized protein n=1 Tax=Nonomuraea typhae TaxID=2603600 RepID=A0ABW7YJ21_9ACTN